MYTERRRVLRRIPKRFQVFSKRFKSPQRRLLVPSRASLNASSPAYGRTPHPGGASSGRNRRSTSDRRRFEAGERTGSSLRGASWQSNPWTVKEIRHQYICPYESKNKHTLNHGWSLTSLTPPLSDPSRCTALTDRKRRTTSLNAGDTPSGNAYLAAKMRRI